MSRETPDSWRTSHDWQRYAHGLSLRDWPGWYTPSGKTLASASYDGTVRLWDAATGKEKAVLKGHTDKVQRLSFSRNGRILATTGNDQTIRLWQLGR
jgi:WD40 repeat protein